MGTEEEDAEARGLRSKGGWERRIRYFTTMWEWGSRASWERNSPCGYNYSTKAPPPPTSSSLGAQALLARTARYLIVGAHIEQDGEALLWIDSSACGVQGQLAHRDAHAVAAQVSQAQYALSIGHHHSLQNTAGHPQSGALPA